MAKARECVRESESKSERESESSTQTDWRVVKEMESKMERAR